MAKKAKIKKKRSGIHMPVDVKVGILHTVADAIYSTPAGKLREAVANARDNNATWAIIVIDQGNRSIYICDNGSGISKKRFQYIFQAIGYGWGRDTAEKKVSYFGLGLMSIFQLGNKIEMFTRPKGEKKILKLEVDTEAIFSEANEKKSISSLKRYISVNDSNEESRRSASANLINESFAREEFKSTRDSFTEIIIRDINEEALDAICANDFIDELRKWLPLKPNRDEPFLNQLTGDNGKAVRKLLENDKFCKTVEVYFGMEEEKKVEQLWKYFPVFRGDLTFNDDNIYVGISRNKDFAYYFVHSIAVDLQRKRGGDREDNRENEEERETGFWIRNQNFLVKSADFLERSGPGRKTKPIHAPLKPWIFGEIFHADMNAFLTVSRNDFLFEDNAFKVFQDEIVEIVDPLNKELRTIYTKKKELLESLVDPFIKLRDPKGGSIMATESRLREIMQHDGTDKQFWEDARKYLKNARNKGIEREDARVDTILKKTRRPLTLGEEKDIIVKVDPSLRGKIQDCDVTWDAKNKKVVALLSPDLFEPKELTFLGTSFKIFFVADKETSAGVSVDVDNRKIWVNPFNMELTRYTVSILDVYLALQVAAAISQDNKEMVKNALALLGARSEIAERYITPFGDDLRRTLELSHTGS